MVSTRIPGSAKEYVAARDQPLAYPGKRPEGSFIVSNGVVYPVVYDEKDKGGHDSTYAGNVVIDGDGTFKTIDDFLNEQGVASLSERFAVLGYGSKITVPDTTKKVISDLVDNFAVAFFKARDEL